MSSIIFRDEWKHLYKTFEFESIDKNNHMWVTIEDDDRNEYFVLNREEVKQLRDYLTDQLNK